MSVDTQINQSTNWRQNLAQWLERPAVTTLITVLIIINAIVLGLETSPRMMADYGALLVTIDKTLLIVFVAEIVAKLVAHGARFFKSGWNIFDVLVVGIALLPISDNLSVLRALRILRVLRLLSIVPQMRRVVGALLGALPGMGAIVMVLLLLFYVSAVLTTKLFGGAFPQWFGSIGGSLYTLFQIMTLDGWSNETVRPILAVYPWAWLFFIPFILLITFAVLNLFIALMVESMQRLHAEESAAEHAAVLAIEQKGEQEILAEIKALRTELQQFKQELREPAKPQF